MDENRHYSPEELKNLLKSELQKTPAEIDASRVQQLMADLKQCGMDTNLQDDDAVEAACRKYKESITTSAKRKKSWKHNWMLKAAVVVLAVSLMLFALPGTVGAENVKGFLTRWTSSIFHFFAPGATPTDTFTYTFHTEHPGLQQVYEAVTELGITEPVVPMWLPEGFELLELKTFELLEGQSIVAQFSNNENYVCLTIGLHGRDKKYQYEKNGENIERYELNGTAHYIVTDTEKTVIAWMVNTAECSVVTDCREDELHQILYSIYTTEGIQ